MLTALVLVCSLAITADIQQCNQANAVDVLRVPELFAHPAACAMQGQAYLAQTTMGRHLRADEVAKVVCAPTARVVGRAESIEHWRVDGRHL
jgi:hypothetical protein